MTSRLQRWTLRPFMAPAVLVLLGVLWRLMWLAWFRPFEIRQVEAVNAALAFARTGRFADALGPGEGLTAHLSPVMPVLSGLVYQVLGIQTAAANWLLSLVALGLSIGSALFLYRSFGLMGVSRTSRLFGLGLYCLVPLSPFTEMVEFRHWEGGLAVFLATGLLMLIVTVDASGATSWRARFAVSLLAAILFFVNPPLGLAGYAMAVILLCRRLAWRSYPATIGMAALVLIAVLTPWTIRNYQAFGSFVPLRGNAGMELALANHSAAVSGHDQQAVFRARLFAIHPHGNPPVFARMQAAGGEIPYAAKLGSEAKGWIATHPLDFARLSLRHLVQFYFPPEWLWTVYGNFSHATLVKQGIIWVTAALGLCGALAGAFVWRGRLLYAATLALIPAIPYLMVQPILRYHYLVSGILLFLAADVIIRALDYSSTNLRLRNEHTPAS